MLHTSIKGRKPATAPLIPLAAMIVAASFGLTACGGSASTSTQTTAKAAATGATGTSSSGTSSSGTSSSPGTSPSGTSSSGTSATGAPPAGVPNPAHFTATRECLAKKGITLPKRTPSSSGSFSGARPQLPKGMTRTQFSEALKSCGGGSGFGGRGFRKGPRAFDSPRFHQALVRFSACLRQNGVNVGEPNTSGKGPIFNTKGINTGSPQFRAAATKCRTALFGALRPKASPGAAGGATG
jgi:hypothetical protein